MTLYPHGHDETWRQHAACVDDPDRMFPTSTSPAATAAAKAVCAHCPVIAQCEDWIMRFEGNCGRDNRHGIYAKRTGAERYRLYLARRDAATEQANDDTPAAAPHKGGRRPAECGTYSAYQRHARYGEPIDDACREAHNTHRREQRAANRAAAKAA